MAKCPQDRQSLNFCAALEAIDESIPTSASDFRTLSANAWKGTPYDATSGGVSIFH